MLKHPLYPLIEKYIKEYLHGFTKRQFDIAITKGELKFQYLNLRPDTINKKMDEKNLPFWLKAGLIKKISIGCSLMNIIGEIPLELKMEGFDIIINPSYKWFLKNINSYQQNSIKTQFFGGDFQNLNIKSPLNIDFKSNKEDFDKSIFIQIKELFKDKSIISTILNIFYEKCYQFYLQKNNPVSIKLKNIHIRFEDDFFINYQENIVFGIRIDSIDIKFGKKGNMKKNYIAISKLDMYWENDPKILIPSYFLHSLYVNGELQESYYTQLQDIKFQNFNYHRNTKFIIENFNSTINFGTKILNNSKNVDIFNIKDKPCILYIQISTGEININIWPEVIKIVDTFNQFTDKFKILEKVEDYKPRNRPNDIKKQNSNNFKINIDININKKLLIRNWFYYFLYCKKMQNYINNKNNNPLRVEFLRYYNIFCKKAEISEKKEEKKENKFHSNLNNNNNNDLPIKLIQNENNNNNNIELKNIINSNNNSNKKNSYDFFSLNSKNNNKNKLLFNNKSVINITSYLNEQKRKQHEENIKIKQINLVFISDLLIKSLKINIHPSLKKDNINYLKIKIQDIQTKILLSKEKLDLNISTKNIHFTPYNIVYGEREILSDESYRQLYQEPEANIKQYETLQNMNYPYYINTEFNNNFTYNNLIHNGPVNDNKVKNMNINDIISVEENINNRRSRGSSFESRNKNKNINNNINNLNNNLMNSNNNIGNGINNRPLNTIQNNYNYYNNLNNSNRNIYINNNPQINYNYNSYDNNSINNGINNRKSFIRMTVGRKTNGSYLEDDKYSTNQTNTNNLSKKQRKEIDISNAVNNYNSYKIKQRSHTPLSMIRKKLVKKSINKKNGKKEPFSNKNIPLNLLEIYSNSNNNSFNLSFIKYNNPVSIDSFMVKIGTIRTNFFINYLQESLKIFNDYNEIYNYEKRKSFWETFMENKNMEINKNLFYMKNYFYKKLNLLPDCQKTEAMIKYSEYLRKEVMLIKIFNSKVVDFQLNYLFSIFNNGLKFNFSFENIECVYYSKYKKISGKFIIPLNEFEIIMNLKKINIRLFGMELQINDLEDTKSIIKKIQKIFKAKMAMTEILIEPCYTMIKKELYKEIEKSKSEDFKKEEEKDNINNKYTNIKTNDEIKNNNIINTNINSNKILYDDNIILNSLHKDIIEDEKNYKNDNNIINNRNINYNEDEK